MLDNEALAKVLLTSLGPLSSTLGFDKTTSEIVKKWQQSHGEELKKLLFEEEGAFDKLAEEMGHSKKE